MLPLLVLAALSFAHAQDLDSNFVMLRHEEPIPGPVPSRIFLKAADFDGDGKSDLLAAPNDLLFLRGKGDGTFQPAIVVQPSAGLDGGAQVADFDGDGRLDLIGPRTVYMGNGDGTFRAVAVTEPLASIAPSFIPVNLGSNKINAVVADFNEDGKADIAGGDSSAYRVLLSNGDGSFRSGFSTAGPHMAAFTTDLNLDGHADLILQASLVNQAAVFRVFLGDGRGSFQQAANLMFSHSAIYSLLGDFNGDRIPDFWFYSIHSPDMYLVLGNPNGTFQNPASKGLRFNAVTTGDVNADGALDLVIRTGAFTSVLLGRGDGTFSSPARLGPSGTTVLADWNGDKRLDLAVYDSGVLSILLNKVLVPGEVSFSDAESSADATPHLAPGSLASLVGAGYSTLTQASSVPVSTLGDVQLRLLDAAGQTHPADLLYVSPRQINFRIPPAAALGAATVELASASGTPGFVAVGRAQLSASAPTVFTCPGTYTLLATAEADSGEPQRMDVCSDIRFNFPARVTFYGTGFVGATTENTRVSVLGQPVVPEFVGPAGTVPGLEKIVIHVEKAPTDDGDSYGSWISITVNGAEVGRGYSAVY